MHLWIGGIDLFGIKRARRNERILALETRCRVNEEAHAAFKKDMHGLMEELADILEARGKRIEELETRVAALEEMHKPVISDLTAGGEKPLTAAQLMDEWMNGKPEGSEDK